MKCSFLGCVFAVCAAICVITGCQQMPGEDSSRDLSNRLDALGKRIKDLETNPSQSASENLPPLDAAGQVRIDSSKAVSVFADATHAMEAGHHVVIHFATRNFPVGNGPEATSRLPVYLNYFTAKRLENALTISVERHVAVFGKVEPVETTTQIPEDKNDKPIYANFVRITGNPEELMVDVGINPQSVANPTSPPPVVPITCTVIFDYHTATRLQRQIARLIAEYEAKHGFIETDIQKRIK